MFNKFQTYNVNKTPNSLQIGGVKRLWDIDNYKSLTFNGLDISQAKDLSGNKGNAVQSTAINQPLYVEDALNENAGIRFTRGSHFMTAPSLGVNNINGIEVFVVCSNINPSGSNDLIFGRWESVVGGRQFVIAKDSSDYFYAGFSYDGTNAAPSIFSTVKNQGILNFSHDGTIGKFYVNNNLIGSETAALYANPPTDYHFCMVNGVPNCGGNILKVILFDRKLSDAERTKVFTDLSNEYGIG